MVVGGVSGMTLLAQQLVLDSSSIYAESGSDAVE